MAFGPSIRRFMRAFSIASSSLSVRAERSPPQAYPASRASSSPARAAVGFGKRTTTAAPKPIFDSASTGSIGDIAVSPSHPEIIYVGSGESIYREDLSVGDGVFKSTDSGHTWEHIGLREVQQVGRIVVHPNNPSIVFVTGCGRSFGPNEERGVFRTSDGGKTWKKVLYIDHNTGAKDSSHKWDSRNLIFVLPHAPYYAAQRHRSEFRC